MTKSGYSSNSLFFPAKNKRLSAAISIKNPSAFKTSISRVRKIKGISPTTKKRALVLARTRAKVALNRSNLSTKEQREMRKIAKTPIGAFK